MAPAQHTALDGIDRVVVDGSNLLHRLGQGSAAPPAAIVGRLRAAIPAEVEIQLVFDGVGHGVTGRVAQLMHVRWSGRRTGDAVILDLLGVAPSDAARVLVVTDDRELRSALTMRGARTVPLRWLTDRLEIPALANSPTGARRPTIGGGRPPAGSPRSGADTDDDVSRPTWRPGRGATEKTGPAHKIARHKRHPNNP